MIKLDMVACLAVIGGLLALVVQYWVLRLAVRGGIEDTVRRQRARAAEQAWARQRPEPEAGADPQEGPGT